MTTTQSDTGVLTGTRILVVMPTIPLHGMERSTLQVMRGLRERGADILFITQKEHGQNIQREVEGIGCRWVAASFDKLLHLSRKPREMARVFQTWARSATELHRIRKAYRPTHIHIPNITLFLYSWPVLLFARETIVFALPDPPDAGFTGFKRHLNNFIWRHGVGRVCDYIICNSEFTLSQVNAIGIPMDNLPTAYPPGEADYSTDSPRLNKLSIIYNSVPVRTRRVGDAPVVDRSKVNVAYVGRICPDKGVRDFIQAALRVVAERDDVDFHLVGDYKWQNPFAEELIAELGSKGIAEKVHFHGVINDVTDFLSQCDLHVCPSVCEEAFGLVVIEAKSESLPSVVFPSGGLKELVSHLTDGYVCAGKTSAALYEGIAYFLDRPEAMKDAGRAAKRSLEKFSSTKMKEAWCNLYKNSKQR